MEQISNETGEVTELPEISLNWCEFCPASKQEGTLQTLKETVPQGYQYICCQQESTREFPRVDFRVNVKDEQSAKEWLVKYQETTLATWRTARTYPNRGSRTLCRLEKRCQHMTCPRSKSADQRKGSKNTNCPAALTVIVRRTEFKRQNGKDRTCRSVDHHLPQWPMTVILKHDHNHPLKAADVLRHRDVSKHVRKKLIKLFLAGHSPTSALNMHQYDLQMEHGDNYVFLSGDRHHNPDLNFTWRLYNQIFGKEKSNRERLKYMPGSGEVTDDASGRTKDKKSFSANANPEMVKMLREKIDRYNLENGDCVRMQVEDNQLVMAIITPLMKRTHALVKYAGEMVFMDASGNMSRHNTQVYMMMTPSFAGGLPLGAFITTGDSKPLVHSAIELGQEILGDTAFYGRGKAGPEVFFTDDLVEERSALGAGYPQSTLILCIYQVLQAFWKHLFDPRVKNQRGDGPYLFQLMKSMLYASSETELEVAYQTILHDEIADKYSAVKSMYLKMYERRIEWALCYQNKLPLCGNNTSNYCESAMRILKDKIFHRAKTYNIVQLVDFLLTRMDQYYQKRLLDVGHNRLYEALGSRYVSSGVAAFTHKDQIIRESAMVFLILNEKSTEQPYRVDMTVGLCTCRVGSAGGPCCHQKAVLTGFYIPSWNFISVNDEAMSKLLFQIAGTVEEEESLPSRKHPREEDISETDDFEQEPSAVDDTPLEARRVGTGAKRRKSIQKAVSPKVNQKKVLSELDSFIARIKSGYLKNPCVFKDALEDFVHQTKKCKTDAELVCALYTFGD